MAFHYPGSVLQRKRSLTAGSAVLGLGSNAVIEPPIPAEGRTTRRGREDIPVQELEKLSEVLLNNARSSPADSYLDALGAKRCWGKFQCTSADTFVFFERI